MARQRRGGFRPPELRGTLGTLFRTTTGVVRDALERGAREGRSRVEEALSSRRRGDALAELGEIVLDLIRRGEIDLGELPEVRDIVAHLDEIDEGTGHDDEDAGAAPPRAALRARFDDRPSRPPSSGSRPSSSGARRSSDARPSSDDADETTPPRPTFVRPSGTRPSGTRPSDARPSGASRGREADSDTVSSAGWTPPARTTPAAARVWRPVPPPADDDAPSDHRADDEHTTPERPSPRRSPVPVPGQKKGGISFDDEDLADYMHPDDVPPKGPPDGDS